MVESKSNLSYSAGKELAQDAGARTQSMHGALADAMTRLKKQYYGRGPERARTIISDEYVIVVLEGGLTRNEETLLQAGEDETIRQYRLRFESVVRDTAIAAVQELTGRTVLTYHSQILFRPTRVFEMFVLERPVDQSWQGDEPASENRPPDSGTNRQS